MFFYFYFCISTSFATVRKILFFGFWFFVFFSLRRTQYIAVGFYSSQSSHVADPKEQNSKCVSTMVQYNFERIGSFVLRNNMTDGIL